MPKQFLIYICVGLATAVIDVGTMQLLISAGMHYKIAVTIAFFLSLFVNFKWHQRYTFQSQYTHSTFMRYGVVVAMNYVLTLACVQMSVSLLDSVLIGKLASLPIIAVHGYLWGRFWVFRQ